MTLRFFVKRTIIMVLTIFLAFSLSFVLIRSLPGDPAERFYGDPRLPEAIKLEIRASFGLDKPVWDQFWVFLGQAFRGDLGVSYTHSRKAMDVIMERIPWTLVLTAIPTLLSMVVALKVGIFCAFNRNGFTDRFMRFFAFGLNSMPTFWLALLIVMGLGFYLNLFPLQGMFDPLAQSGWNRFWSTLHHAFLPWMTLFIVSMPSFAIQVRNLSIHILGEDYILTARAKGLKTKDIRNRHVLRNALGPLFSLLTLRVAGLVGGAVLIETIFSWKGMGLLVLEASQNSDFPLLQATVLITVVLVIVANFLADVLQALFDPRVRFQ